MQEPVRNRFFRGSALIIAFAVLSLISLAMFGLIKTVETNILIAGNIIYKRSTLYSAEKGIQEAIDWLTPRILSNELYSDNKLNGYFASYGADVAFVNRNEEGAKIYFDWDGSHCSGSDVSLCMQPKVLSTSINEPNEIQYVIHRLCKTVGSPDDPKNNCKINVQNMNASPQRGQMSYAQSVRFSNADFLYYAITVRVKGPKNTVTYIQSIIHF